MPPQNRLPPSPKGGGAGKETKASLKVSDIYSSSFTWFLPKILSLILRELRKKEELSHTPNGGPFVAIRNHAIFRGYLVKLVP